MEQARESSDEWSRDQPPMGGQRGRGQALPGFDPVLLVSLEGGVCSRSAQKEGGKAAATLTVDSFGAPSSTALKSWLVVARGASAPLRLVGHLGWVHQHEARPVGEPRERMGGREGRRTTGQNRAGLPRKDEASRGGGPNKLHHRYWVPPPARFPSLYMYLQCWVKGA